MTEWKKVKLGECISTKKGFAFKSALYTDSGVPVVRVSDFTLDSVSDKELVYYPQTEKDSYCEYVLNTGDILIQTVGSWQYNPNSVVGKVVRVPYYHKGSLLNQNIVKIIPNKDYNNAFLFYRLKCRDFAGHVIGEARGAANQASITLDTIKNFRFDCPPIEIQHRIASILSRYDSLIENYQKQIKLLEEAAQRLYKEWFVDLHFPGHENTKIVDGVPEGWKKKKISDVCNTIGGGTPSTKVLSYYENGTISWVTPTDITKNNSLCLLSTEKKITKEGLDNSSAKMLPVETILMTSRASVGYFGICDFEVCTNQGFISCVPFDNNFQMYLLYNLMNRVEEIRIKAGGSTYLEISKSVFRNFDIICPTDDIVCVFQKETHQQLERMRMISKQIRLLTEARDRLLPKLMSGEIKV